MILSTRERQVLNDLSRGLRFKAAGRGTQDAIRRARARNGFATTAELMYAYGREAGLKEPTRG